MVAEGFEEMVRCSQAGGRLAGERMAGGKQLEGGLQEFGRSEGLQEGGGGKGWS